MVDGAVPCVFVAGVVGIMGLRSEAVGGPEGDCSLSQGLPSRKAGGCVVVAVAVAVAGADAVLAAAGGAAVGGTSDDDACEAVVLLLLVAAVVVAVEVVAGEGAGEAAGAGMDATTAAALGGEIGRQQRTSLSFPPVYSRPSLATTTA